EFLDYGGMDCHDGGGLRCCGGGGDGVWE
ncbi:hypothetical protein Tco_0713004, partial [Tanacetum coccineum]